MILLTLALLQFISSCEAQYCILATNGNRSLPNFVRPGAGGVPQFRLSPIQAIITSYKFNCCGVVTEWRAIVHRSSGIHYQTQAYTMSFQVWRPNSPSPVDTDGCYTMIGVNHFSPISLADRQGPDRGIVTGTPAESDRIEFQPGDVVGFYLESSLYHDDSVQFAGDTDNTSPYTDESVWFANNSITTEGPPTCPFPVGAFGTLSSSTNRAPLITATVSMSDCPVATAIQPSATPHISTPTLHSQSSYKVPHPHSHSHTTSQELSTPSPPSPTSQEVPTSISPPKESQDPTYSFLPSHESLASTHTLPSQESSISTHFSPPSQESHLPAITTDTPQLIEGAGNVGLYVGTLVPVSVLVVGTVLVVLIIAFCVVKKKGKGLREVAAYRREGSRNYAEQDHFYSTIHYGKDLRTKTNTACGKFNAPAEYYCITDLPSNIPVTQNPAYGDIHTTVDKHLNFYVSDRLDETDDGMILNEIYFATKQSSSGNDPSILTTENEAYTERVDNETNYNCIN